MKAVVFTLLVLVSVTLKAQHMETPKEAIIKMFVATDERQWEIVANSFAETVKLDYSSMTGNPSAILKPNEIVGSWKTVLPGFTVTHHQLGNFICRIDGNRATTFAYGTATHYLEDEDGSIWTVVGTYDFDLKKMENEWKITAMTFNYKYQDGNRKLIEKAIENAKSK